MSREHHAGCTPSHVMSPWLSSAFAKEAPWLPMIIPTTNHFTFEVTFSGANREPGFEDDIRVAMWESGPATTRMLKGDRCSVLLTIEEAERMAEALLKAAAASRSVARPERRTNRSRQRRPAHSS
jgi:hypothetical protein